LIAGWPATLPQGQLIDTTERYEEAYRQLPARYSPTVSVLYRLRRAAADPTNHGNGPGTRTRLRLNVSSSPRHVAANAAARSTATASTAGPRTDRHLCSWQQTIPLRQEPGQGCMDGPALVTFPLVWPTWGRPTSVPVCNPAGRFAGLFAGRQTSTAHRVECS